MPTFLFISFSSLIFFSRGAARALQEGNDIDTLILECGEYVSRVLWGRIGRNSS